jgi:hypothetical protein
MTVFELVEQDGDKTGILVDTAKENQARKPLDSVSAAAAETDTKQSKEVAKTIAEKSQIDCQMFD